jgi:hypothetical protein
MFSYTPLSRQNNEWRLIRFVRPVIPQTRIELEIRHTSIDDSGPPYTALSYVWGDVKMTIEIQINGQPFAIGYNLYAALKQLLQNGVYSWLWVDAICIHQSDTEEKSWQVNQMRTIYSRSDLVYIWLGLGSDENNKAMDFVCRVGPRALASGALDLWPDWKPRKEVRDYIETRPPSQQVDVNADGVTGSELARFIFDLLHEDDLRVPASSQGSLGAGICDLLRREYWHRIWIVQEVALTKEALVLCGEKSVSLDIFDATFLAVWHCKRSGLFNLHPEYKVFGSGLVSTLYTIKALVTRRQHRRRVQIRLADFLFETGAAPDRPFYSSSDPRDIAFALLGIVTDNESLGLSADYNMTLVEVFSAMTRALIREGDKQHRPSFHLHRCVPRTRNTNHLPSWVPDWREIGKYGVKVYPVNHLEVFNATAGMLPPSPVTTSRDDYSAVLCRPGCRVDTIIEVMQPPEWSQRDKWTASRIRDASAWLSSVFHFAGLGPESGPGEDDIWRIIMVDRLDGASRPNSHEPKPMSQDIARLIRKIMRQEHIDCNSLTDDQIEFISKGPFSLSARRPDLETVDDQLTYIVRHWPEVIGSVDRGRTLFKTAKGMFGLGHTVIQAGDMVSLLWGLRSPIILRPRDDVHCSGGFHFVGDAYVDGIMYGEFLETRPEQENFDIY